MKVAILGTGGIGRSYAAFLADKGHEPILWSPTGTGPVGPTIDLVSTGIVEKTQKVAIAATCAEAVADVDTVIVAVMGTGLRTTLEALAGHVRDGQVVIISGHLSVAGIFLSKLLSARGISATIAAWPTTALFGRRGAGNTVRVSGQRTMLNVGTIPSRDVDIGLARSIALFGDGFQASPNVLAIMLANLNPQFHIANSLCNLTRMERGESWSNYGCITPAVSRLIKSLDVERLQLAASFGLQVRTVEDHCVASYGAPDGDFVAMMEAVAITRAELKGPTSLDTRYVTEDVPFGLVTLTLLGKLAGKPMPLHEAGLKVISALYSRDFTADNDLLPLVNLQTWTKEQLLEALA